MKHGLLLNIRKCIVVFLLENQKWDIYIKYLNMMKAIRRIFKGSRNKNLTASSYESIISSIYENIDILNLQNACLIRSALGMLYLVGYKNNFSLNIGVKINPFISHAWLSLDDEPIFEKQEIQSYKILLSVNNK
jgi:hypothetical protein